jgi:hypothetical protein
VPTTRPRYQVTDTGRVEALLDRASRAFPDIAHDRKALLLRLAELGADALPTACRPALVEQLRANAGRWVAVRDESVLTSATDPEGVVAWLREHDERAAQTFRVPAEDGQLGSSHGLA